MIDEYTDSNINTDECITIPSFAKRVAYLKQKLGNPIGNGSSRTVFAIDNNKVIKLAKNQKGIAQNEAEYDNCNDCYMGNMFANVFEYDNKGFTYIIAERTRKPMVSDFKNIFGVSYYKFCQICLGAECEYKPYRFNNIKLTDKDYELIENNEDLRMWYDYITNYQPFSVKEIIRKSNLGVVNRNGYDEMIIIDSGFNADTAKLYEAVSKTIRQFLSR